MKPNLRRLRILADWLEKVPPERFYLGHWTNCEGPPDIASCGTTACAVGWGAACPELRAEGLRLNRLGVPAFDGEDFWAAVERFFGLAQGPAERLFYSCCYPRGDSTRLPTVIKRIRAFIAKHEAA